MVGILVWIHWWIDCLVNSLRVPNDSLTVSFFTKGGNEGMGGLMKASLYGLFILLIYTSLSIPFHFNTDPEVLSEVATSVG